MEPLPTSRAKNTKVRSGCTTCKSRRVKCDEAKPQCQNCVKSSRNCGYQDHNVLHARRTSHFLPIRPRDDSGSMSSDEPKRFHNSHNKPPGDAAMDHHQAALLSVNPSTAIPGDAKDRRYFQLFRERTTYDLCSDSKLFRMIGSRQNSFWTTLIVQQCHHEPAIRHQVLALSALYNASMSKHDRTNEHYKFALVEQNKALACVRQKLAENTFPIRLALMTSVILGYIESLHGNIEAASRQVTSGANLLQSWHQANSSGFVSKGAAQESASISPELYAVLPPLGLQLLSYMAMNAISTGYFLESESAIVVTNVPDRFETIYEAFPFVTQMSKLAFSHLGNCRQFKVQPSVALPTWLLEEQETLRSILKRWNDAFQPAWKVFSRNEDNETPSGMYVVNVYVHIYMIIAETAAELEEARFESFLDSFEYVVMMCGEIIKKEEALRKTNDVRLSFNTGIIMPLFYVATRCRKSSLRREAITLLKEFPSRNGIWDSVQAYKIAQWMVDVEEDDANGLTLKQWRLCTDTLKWSIVGDSIFVECMQGSRTGIMTPRKAELPLY